MFCCFQQADESLNFEEQILEAAKAIANATSALVKAASAAQKELVQQGKVRNLKFVISISEKKNVKAFFQKWFQEADNLILIRSGPCLHMLTNTVIII